MRKCLICWERKMEDYGICEDCKKLNREMADIHVDLTGYTALVTGGRIKIGYATAIRMLRDGAKVIVITRYPYDALDRYSKEPDYNEFKERLIICGFNLMWVNKLDNLLEFIHKAAPQGLDILVNNAAQTIKKASSYYAQLEEREQQMKALYQKKEASQLVSTVSDSVQPEYMLMQKENTPTIKEESLMYNSWVAKAEEISVQEMLEVQLINVTAPFMLVGQLKEWMKKSSHKNKFIINVSSVEGRFNRNKKLSRHVHTNMAKASLNMMTHSLGMEYEKDRIFMYSVDPGWVSNQFPAGYNASKEFKQYLSFEDGASRICYPIYTKLDTDVIKDAGTLWKDYKIVEF
ncbi:MAG: SDR family oxidoreductase [Lachnospiraceae bacterium]|nr:SDR family oxidoreductase [Lachnospiraceae bacterium]